MRRGLVVRCRMVAVWTVCGVSVGDVGPSGCCAMGVGCCGSVAGHAGIAGGSWLWEG
jgi:hypothetical protein